MDRSSECKKLISLLRRCASARLGNGMRLDEGDGDLPTELREVLADAAIAQRQPRPAKRRLARGFQTRR